jgi:hypothetical protein
VEGECGACGAPLAEGEAECSSCATVIWPDVRVGARRRKRLPRRMRGLAAGGVVLAAIVGASAMLDDRDHDAAGRVGARMVPPVTVEAGRAELRFSLPSGQRYVVSYPESLELAALGAVTGVSVDWVGEAEEPANGTCCDRVVRFRYAAPDELFPGIDAERELEPAARVVQRGPSAESGLDDLAGGGWVIISVERWSAAIEIAVPSQGFAPISPAEQQKLARAFQATIRPDQFPVLRLGTSFDVHADTAGITFGSFDGADSPRLELTPFYCGKPGSNTSARRRFELDGVDSVVWCEPLTGLFVRASGPEQFVDAVADGLATRLG